MHEIALQPLLREQSEPKTVTMENNVTKVYDLGLANRRFKVCEIAETVRISNTTWVISCTKYWNKESVGTLGAAFAYAKQQRKLWEQFTAAFDAVLDAKQISN